MISFSKCQVWSWQRRQTIEKLEDVIDLDACPLGNENFIASGKTTLAEDGVLTLPGFLRAEVIETLVTEAETQKHNAYFTASTHNVYLTEPRPELGEDHVYNRQLASSKGCITTDQVPVGSGLHTIYDSSLFRQFVAQIVGESGLYEYADPLASINVHFASEDQELNWHFDNSDFAITLLLQAPRDGGYFEYVRDLRNAEGDDMNFAGVTAILDGKMQPSVLSMEPGTLVLFRGRNSIHRVTPTIGDQTRILVVLAYNAAPEIALSESARMTFFGRLG